MTDRKQHKRTSAAGAPHADKGVEGLGGREAGQVGPIGANWPARIAEGSSGIDPSDIHVGSSLGAGIGAKRTFDLDEDLNEPSGTMHGGDLVRTLILNQECVPPTPAPCFTNHPD